MAECSAAKRRADDAAVECSAAKRACKDADVERMNAEYEAIMAEHGRREAENKVELVQHDLDNTKQVLSTWANTHSFIMLRLNDPNAIMPYYAIRRLNRDMQKRVIKMRKQFPNAIMVYQQPSSPNAVNLYKRLRSSGFVSTDANYCRLRNNASEA